MRKGQVNINGKIVQGFIVCQSLMTEVIWVPTDESWAYFHLFVIRKKREGLKWVKVIEPICGPIAKEEFKMDLDEISEQ